MKHLPFSTNAVALLTAAVIAISLTMAPAAQAQNTRVFELRTYYAHEGKLDDLMARFRNHTTKLFEKHGMTNIGYWVPLDADKGADNTLIYIIAHKSRDAAKTRMTTRFGGFFNASSGKSWISKCLTSS